jgi:hypothetical protein
MRRTRGSSAIRHEGVDSLSVAIGVDNLMEQEQESEQNFETVQDPSSEDISVQDMETIEKIKDCLANIHSNKHFGKNANMASLDSTGEAEMALDKTLKSLPNETVRIVVVYELFNAERRKRRKMNRANVRDFFAKCIRSVLNENQMIELYQILKDLPAAALGDAVAQEHTRVLVDVLQDVRNAMGEQRYECRHYRNLIDIAAGLIENCLRQRIDSQELLFHMLKCALDENQAFRAVIAQIILSRLIPYAEAERTAVLRDLFPDSVIQAAQSKNLGQ